MAVGLVLCAWKLKAVHIGYLYSFLGELQKIVCSVSSYYDTHDTIYISAATTSFNAVDNIIELFWGVGYVNGEEVEGDAH